MADRGILSWKNTHVTCSSIAIPVRELLDDKFSEASDTAEEVLRLPDTGCLT